MRIARVTTAAVGLVSAGLIGYVAGDRRARDADDGGSGKRHFRRLDVSTLLLPTAASAATSTTVPGGSLLPMPQTAPTPLTSPPSGADRGRQILRFGAPTMEGVRVFDDFVLAYDRRLRLPAWVFERLGPETRPRSDAAAVDRAGLDFYQDLGQHPYFRASNADYAGSGYDRGHMAAAGNHKADRAACQQTFILSNICPQVGHGFNRHLWNSLERYVRSLARHYVAVYVCSGPLFLPSQPPGSKRKFVQYEVLGSGGVAVPTHFFKVVLLETHLQQFELLCYVVPNVAHPTDPEPSLDQFLVPLDSIERAAGFLIFDQLPRNAVTRVNKRPV